jgi:uncharacterized membrane protein YfcA
MAVLPLLGIGLVGGISGGLFGIGGGMIIVPALVHLLGFSQHKATGTSLAALLPPVAFVAVIHYYRHGNVDVQTGLWIALGLVFGAWLGAIFANRTPEAYLRFYFGLFIVSVGFYMIIKATKSLGWI